MTEAETKEFEAFMKGLKSRNPHQKEFHQAVAEVAESVMPWYLQHEEFRRARILERLTEPDRIVSFRVTWETDSGEIRVNRAWRVQFSNALGPYKGGLRFHPSVDESVLKFLGFEQIFKNSLTGLPMGGAKGGSNFNPKGKSEREVMRFCHSLMMELHRHIGEYVDVPAGDIESPPTRPQGRRESGGVKSEFLLWGWSSGEVEISARVSGCSWFGSLEERVKGGRLGSSHECLSFPVEHLRFSRDAACYPRVCCGSRCKAPVARFGPGKRKSGLI